MTIQYDDWFKALKNSKWKKEKIEIYGLSYPNEHLQEINKLKYKGLERLAGYGFIITDFKRNVMEVLPEDHAKFKGSSEKKINIEDFYLEILKPKGIPKDGDALPLIACISTLSAMPRIVDTSASDNKIIIHYYSLASEYLG